MPNVFATRNGVWSDTNIWNTSALPATVDDVFANSFSVTIDTNARVLSINTLSAVGISRGGRFFINNGISLSADVVSGGSTVLTFLSASPNSCTLFGSITGGNGPFAGGPYFGVLNSSSGTMNIISPRVESWASTNSYSNASQNAVVGNTSSGTVNISAGNILLRFNIGFLNNSTGSISITGNITSGSEATVPFGFFNSGSGSIFVLGNVSGGAGINIAGGTNTSNGTVTVTGNVSGQGSVGINNTSSGTVNVRGGVFAGPVSGIVSSSTGTINVTGNVLGGPSINSRGINSTGAGIVNIIGNCTGGTASNTEAINSTNAGSIVNIIGNVTSNGSGIGVGNSGTTTIVGDVSGQIAANSNAYGFLHNNGTTTSIISGNIFARGGNGVRNNSSGTLIIYGNVRAGTAGSVHGVSNLTNGTVYVFGDVSGGSGSTQSYGLFNQGVGGIAYISGNAFGGTGTDSVGAINNVSAFISISGNAIAGTGSVAYGASNVATGYLEVNGLAIGNGFGLGSAGINTAPGIFGSQTGTTIIRGLSCGPRGQWPTAGNVLIVPQNTSTATLETSAFQDVTLFTSLSTNIVPPASSVRLETVYNLNQSTGTCAMPSISSVLQGVSVDNSVGIAALQPQTIWNYSVLSATDVNSLGGRLKEVATVQSVGQQLTALN